MWRSLFYSFGIGLFILGLQALVLDYVTVPKNTRLQRVIQKVFSDTAGGPQAGVNGGNPQTVAGNFGSPNGRFGQQSSQANNFNTGSRFGPSRFAGPAYGTGYGGGRVQGQPNNGFQGFQPQTVNAQLAGFRTDGSSAGTTQNAPALQKLVIREWMPWSLLASGVIIFLYTHTHQHRGIQD